MIKIFKNNELGIRNSFEALYFMMNFNSNTHSGSSLNRLKVRKDICEDKETNLIKSDVNNGSSSIHSYRKHLTRSDKKMSHHWRLKLINCFIIAVQLLVTQQ